MCINSGGGGSPNTRSRSRKVRPQLRPGVTCSTARHCLVFLTDILSATCPKMPDRPGLMIALRYPDVRVVQAPTVERPACRSRLLCRVTVFVKRRRNSSIALLHKRLNSAISSVRDWTAAMYLTSAPGFNATRQIGQTSSFRVRFENGTLAGSTFGITRTVQSCHSQISRNSSQSSLNKLWSFLLMLNNLLGGT